jgi:DNA-binding transcriptional MerR regulator
MAYQLVRYNQNDEWLYPRPVAAHLAQVTLELLNLCEREGMVHAQSLASGREGYGVAEIQRLVRIRRLRDDLGLSLPAVEVVLHMRRQVLDLRAELDEMEAQMARREQALRDEIRRLRGRLAEPIERVWVESV